MNKKMDQASVRLVHFLFEVSAVCIMHNMFIMMILITMNMLTFNHKRNERHKRKTDE